MAAGARDAGFALHHAKPDYLLMTRWLPQDVPSPLPLFAFTQIGVGGVVINRSGQVGWLLFLPDRTFVDSRTEANDCRFEGKRRAELGLRCDWGRC
eukprot:3565254-Rhodomonas_salina.1